MGDLHVAMKVVIGGKVSGDTCLGVRHDDQVAGREAFMYGGGVQ
jgi:hypothetical protein